MSDPSDIIGFAVPGGQPVYRQPEPVTAVDDLAAWLTQIWDEDEAVAKAAAAEFHAGAHWDAVFCANEGISVNPYGHDEWQTPETVHISRHDPAAVLARIAADRQILAEYVARGRDVDLMLGPPIQQQREWIGLRLAVRILASAYADRPGYREEWRPA